jgi:hypothetical protein
LHPGCGPEVWVARGSGPCGWRSAHAFLRTCASGIGKRLVAQTKLDVFCGPDMRSYVIRANHGLDLLLLRCCLRPTQHANRCRNQTPAPQPQVTAVWRLLARIKRRHLLDPCVRLASVGPSSSSSSPVAANSPPDAKHKARKHHKNKHHRHSLRPSIPRTVAHGDSVRRHAGPAKVKPELVACRCIGARVGVMHRLVLERCAVDVAECVDGRGRCDLQPETVHRMHRRKSVIP